MTAASWIWPQNRTVRTPTGCSLDGTRTGESVGRAGGSASRAAETAHTRNRARGAGAAEVRDRHTLAREAGAGDDGCRTERRGFPLRRRCRAPAGTSMLPSTDSFADCVLVIVDSAVDDANNWHDDDSAEMNMEEDEDYDKEGGGVGEHDQEEAVAEGDHNPGSDVHNKSVVHQRQEVPGETRTRRGVGVGCWKDCVLLRIVDRAEGDALRDAERVDVLRDAAVDAPCNAATVDVPCDAAAGALDDDEEAPRDNG